MYAFDVGSRTLSPIREYRERFGNKGAASKKRLYNITRIQLYIISEICDRGGLNILLNNPNRFFRTFGTKLRDEERPDIKILFGAIRKRYGIRVKKYNSRITVDYPEYETRVYFIVVDKAQISFDRALAERVKWISADNHKEELNRYTKQGINDFREKFKTAIEKKTYKPKPKPKPKTRAKNNWRSSIVSEK